MLSRKTKYGLKALAFLARREDTTPVQIATISASENISQKFLESILLSLRKAGFLGSKKGKGGGYFLRKKSGEISIAEIYRVLEGPIALVPCVSLNFYKKCDDCPDEKACSVHKLMIEVRDKNLAILENTSLKDLTETNRIVE
jgi:Rrf2 family protein